MAALLVPSIPATGFFSARRGFFFSGTGPFAGGTELFFGATDFFPGGTHFFPGGTDLFSGWIELFGRGTRPFVVRTGLFYAGSAYRPTLSPGALPRSVGHYARSASPIHCNPMVLNPTNLKRLTAESVPNFKLRSARDATLILIKGSGDVSYAKKDNEKDLLVEQFDPSTDLLLWPWIGHRSTDVFTLTQEDLDRHYR